MTTLSTHTVMPRRAVASATLSAAIGIVVASLGFGVIGGLHSVQAGAGVDPGSLGGALTNMDGKPVGVNPVMARLGAAGHIRDGAFRSRGAESATEPIICVRRVCNAKE